MLVAAGACSSTSSHFRGSRDPSVQLPCRHSHHVRTLDCVGHRRVRGVFRVRSSHATPFTLCSVTLFPSMPATRPWALTTSVVPFPAEEGSKDAVAPAGPSLAAGLEEVATSSYVELRHGGKALLSNANRVGPDCSRLLRPAHHICIHKNLLAQLP